MNMIIGAILGALIVVSGICGFCWGVQMTAKKSREEIKKLRDKLDKSMG